MAGKHLKKKMKNNNIKSNIQTIGSLTISSIILINCFSYLISSTFKISKDSNHENNCYNYKTVKNTSKSSTYSYVDNTFNIPNEVNEDVINDVITSFGKEVCNDPMFQIQTYIEINNLLMKYNIIRKELNNDEKIAWILDHYNLTMDEFRVVVAVVLAEAEYKSYEDAYATINTIFNRTICTRWISFVNNLQDKNKGLSLYNQVIASGQFSVYFTDGRPYRKYLNVNVEEQPGYQAVIDFLYGTFTLDYSTLEWVWNGPERLHDTLSFVGNWIIPVYSYKMYTSDGNRYGVPMEENEYTDKTFTETDEKTIEARAKEVEEYSRQYTKLILEGYSKEEALVLVRK